MRDFSLFRRRLLGGISAVSLGLLSGVARQAFGATQKPAAAKPNIIFILADDLGFADLSVYGQTDFTTPNLDRLALDGIRFTQAYANSAVCSATRFGLITGRYQYRLRGGLEEPLAGASESLGLPPSHPTLPSLLKKIGYTTALFGKWHLGSLPKFSPLKSGYDKFFGNYGGAIDYFTHKNGVDEKAKEDLYENETPVHQVGYYTDLIAARAKAFITEQSVKKPFFLSVHFTAPHWPWEGPNDEGIAKSLSTLGHYDGGNLATYAKMVGSMDKAVGEILSALNDKNIADNTIVIFTSDNGGERFSRTWPLSGQKSELLEGGIRVPAIVRWPAQVRPAQISQQVIISMDWLPTLLAAAGGTANTHYPPDGENILPAILATAPARPRELFWRYKANNQAAVRSGDWKYLKIANNEFLFNLAEDQSERANLAQKYPDIFSRLKQRWNDWNETMLPITADVRTYKIDAKLQADHYQSQL
ncbi:MAG TPA: sulfatase-like hydrolase/transferase [Cellvibrionaceae bacterium]